MNLDKSGAFNNIVVMGTGGVGGYLGGIFAINITCNWKDKRDLSFIDRGEHLDVMKKKGLTLRLFGQDPVVCIPKILTDNVLELPYINFLLLAVKDCDLEECMKQVKPRLNNLSLIMPVIDGVNVYDRIKDIAPKAIVLPTCVYMNSRLESPGVVKLMSDVVKIYSGPDPQRPDYDGSEIQAFFQNMGMKIYWNEKPFDAIWRKYFAYAPFALVTAASGKTIREACSDAVLKESILRIMGEIREIAGKKGIAITDYDIENTFRSAESLNMDVKSSLQIDIENRNSKNELDTYGANLVKLGLEYGVQTPEAEKYLRLIVNRV